MIEINMKKITKGIVIIKTKTIKNEKNKKTGQAITSILT